MSAIVWINIVLLWGFVFFCFLLIVALARRVNEAVGRPLETLQVGQSAPDFRVETLSEESFSLASFEGRKGLLVFVSPGCGPCLDEFPSINTAYENALADGVMILLVSLDTKERTRELANENMLVPPIAYAPRSKNQIAKDYSIQGTPMYCLVDEDWKVEATGPMDRTWRELLGAWPNSQKKIRRAEVAAL